MWQLPIIAALQYNLLIWQLYIHKGARKQSALIYITPPAYYSISLLCVTGNHCITSLKEMAGLESLASKCFWRIIGSHILLRARTQKRNSFANQRGFLCNYPHKHHYGGIPSTLEIPNDMDFVVTYQHSSCGTLCGESHAWVCLLNYDTSLHKESLLL